MRIKNYKYNLLEIGDLILYQEPHRRTIGIVQSKVHEAGLGLSVRTRDIKIISWNVITSNPILVKEHRINNYEITYFGNITETEFFDKYPEYNL